MTGCAEVVDQAAQAEVETVEIGVPSVLYSRFVNGVPRVAVAWLASIGLYV